MAKFAEILDSIGLSQAASAAKETRVTIKPAPTKDELSLSIQAERALKAPMGNKGPRRQNAREETHETTTDSQGNTTEISSSGNRMAEQQADRIAWETKKWK